MAYAKSKDMDIDAYIQRLHSELKYVFASGEMQVWVDGENLTACLHDHNITQLASEMAKNASLREKLLQLQKSFDTPKGLVAEGRDMGTVIFPEARLKLFLVSDIEIRAKRRLAQFNEVGLERSLEEEMHWLKLRDHRDETRVLSPLIPAKDAILIDTSLGSFQENLEKILTLYQQCKPS
jgi:cytidylate kinase